MIRKLTFINPVTKKRQEVFPNCALGRAVSSGNKRELARICREIERQDHIHRVMTDRYIARDYLIQAIALKGGRFSVVGCHREPAWPHYWPRPQEA